MAGPWSDIDLTELSDLAWGLVDPVQQQHETEEQARSALLPEPAGEELGNRRGRP